MPFNLQRFIDAQNPVYAQVVRELRRGEKRSHWMWFIFPQLEGIGRSKTAQFYGIDGREEAAAYLEHDIIGPRLSECTSLVNDVKGRSIEQIFPYPDNLKFHSCMTLFYELSGRNEFARGLELYFGGRRDETTLTLLW